MLYDDRTRKYAKKDLTYGINSHNCICEQLRMLYDEVYKLPDGARKDTMTELLIDAFIMGKKMADRLGYYKRTYVDATGNNGLNLSRIYGTNKRGKMRRKRGEISFKTPLCELAYQHGNDKCPQIYHSYTPFYYDLFKDCRGSVKKVLEIGIGYPACFGKTVEDYKTGSGLYMWRDFFPNAQIIGIDIEPETIFQDDRIQTFICDQTNPESLKELIEKIGSDIDIVIDDGLHSYDSQKSSCKILMPLLNKNVIYIIEDVLQGRRLEKVLSYRYDVSLNRFSNVPKDDCLVIVKHRR
jgi:hypothetical protein